MLRSWQLLGVRGLPQGIRASSPLGNVFLRPLDELLVESGVRYVRWVDDVVIATEGYHHARELQDGIERRLYDVGLTLAGDKTRIVRYERAYIESRDAKDRLQEKKQSRRQEASDWLADAARWMDYPPDEAQLPDAAELDREAVIESYERLIAQLNEEDLPKGFNADIVAALRELTALSVACELDAIPQLLTRAPDLSREALRYVAEVARSDLDPAVGVFETVLGQQRFMREFEKLELCASILRLPVGRAQALAEPLARMALRDPHELVRARALLAWGAHSRESDFSTADAFWSTATSPWRPYAVVAIQSKTVADRNRRYEQWSTQGHFLGRLANALTSNSIGWRKL